MHKIKDLEAQNEDLKLNINQVDNTHQEEIEELKRLLMVMPHLVVAGRRSLLAHAKINLFEQGPRISVPPPINDVWPFRWRACSSFSRPAVLRAH